MNNHVHSEAPSLMPDLSARLATLYGRVARRLNLDPEFVKAVALGEQESAMVEAALEDELKQIALRQKIHLCPPHGDKGSD
jgi:hypothetical protein